MITIRAAFDAINDALEPFKIYLDLSAIGVTVAAFAQWLPPIAAAFSILWLSTQLYDYWIVKRRKQKEE